MKSRKIAQFGLLVAVAFIFSYIEMLIPLPLPTGVKLGAANIVVLITLYLFGIKEALVLSLVRILLSGLCFGVSTVPYSLAGGFLSLLVMVLLKKSDRFGVPGVSVAGGVMHNIGQTLVAMALLGTKTGFYFPVLFFAGIISGILIGILSAIIIKKLQGHIR